MSTSLKGCNGYDKGFIEYGVVDDDGGIMIAFCRTKKDADLIAAKLNGKEELKPSGALLDAGHFLAKMAHEFICAAEVRHDAPNIAHCRGYVESKGDLMTAIARWKEASDRR